MDRGRRALPYIAPWVPRVGANFGRVRAIELQPQRYDEALRHLHVDDNNRLNPAGAAGWCRVLQLTDDPESFAILRRTVTTPRLRYGFTCCVGRSTWSTPSTSGTSSRTTATGRVTP